MPLPSTRVSAIADLVTARGALRALRNLEYADAGHGYDVFGMHPAWVALAAAGALPFYRRWFRVRSYGIANIPAQGPAILVANHGGLLPFDGMMLWTDVVLRARPPRVPRPVADHFVPVLPLVSTIFSRAGVVGGSRGNVHALLARGELLMIFPEGTAGVGKPARDRYKLAADHWTVGHAEMSIRHGAPVIPVGIIGPDDQMPLALRLPVHAFGSPYVPVAVPPFPLPVRYHIHYGEPIELAARYAPADADDPRAVARAAGEVRAAVEALIARGLAARTGVFA